MFPPCLQVSGVKSEFELGFLHDSTGQYCPSMSIFMAKCHAQLRCHGGHVMTEADGAEALGIPYEWSISVLNAFLCVHTNGPPIARSASFVHLIASFSSHS